MLELMPVFVVDFPVRTGEKDFAVNFVRRDLFYNGYRYHNTAHRRDAVSSLRGVAVFRKAVQKYIQKKTP